MISIGMFYQIEIVLGNFSVTTFEKVFWHHEVGLDNLKFEQKSALFIDRANGQRWKTSAMNYEKFFA